MFICNVLLSLSGFTAAHKTRFSILIAEGPFNFIITLISKYSLLRQGWIRLPNQQTSIPPPLSAANSEINQSLMLGGQRPR
jgi:hypothetical protein